MFSITTKTTYAVHALFELAKNYGNRSVRIRDISAAQLIPEDYLRQLLVILKRAAIVRSERGVSGGYCLAKSPETITVREIIESIEGSLDLRNECSKNGVLLAFWDRSSESIKSAFGATLADLVAEEQKRNDKYVYHI